MLTILYEDQEMIVVKKPAGQESQSSKKFSLDLLSEIKNYLARRDKTANPYVAVVHRLDQPVSGIMVYAKTPRAAANLSQQLQSGKMSKRYYALLRRPIEPSSGTLEHYLVHDKKTYSSHVAQKGEAGAKTARLIYQTVPLGQFAEFAQLAEQMGLNQAVLVDIQLLTGRHHQIRVQFAHMGCPLVGDRRYGAEESDNLMNRVALCAYQLEFFHPTTKRKMKFRIEI
ncbi:MAG: RluA family pseudouridine synthase [Lachnospiraceae bacterium]